MKPDRRNFPANSTISPGKEDRESIADNQIRFLLDTYIAMGKLPEKKRIEIRAQILSAAIQGPK